MAAMLSAGTFEVESKGGGHFRILYRGSVLLEDVAPVVAEDGDEIALKDSFQKLEDGTQVWNFWNEELETRFRMEVASPAAGDHVEISLLGEAPAYPKSPNRLLEARMQYADWKGAEYRGYVGLARTGNREESGTLGDELDDSSPLHRFVWRWLALDGGDERRIVFDLDPIGPSNASPSYPTGVIRGCWQIRKKGEGIVFTGGNRVTESGGLTGAKLVIREGVCSDFSKIHAISKFNYNQHIAATTMDSFGAKTTGAKYFHWDLTPFDAKQKRGWTSIDSPQVAEGPQGAYYSSVSAKNGTFLYSPIPNGFHIFHLAAANYNGLENNFNICLNGRRIVENLSIPPRQIAEIVIPAWITENSAEFRFEGDFLISNMSRQYILSENEDYSFRRGFWKTRGYEPAFYFHTDNYNPDTDFGATVSLLPLPEPGQEEAAPLKTLEKPVELPDTSAPEMAWCSNIHPKLLGVVYSSLNEYVTDPSRLERFITEAKTQGSTVLMVSGMHGRHTFPRTLDDGIRNIGIIAETAHRHGIKVIDHHDTTYLENCEQGFRVMADRAGELSFCVDDFTPSQQLCFNNPTFKRTYRAYLVKLLEAGVDGLQCDELSFYRHGCLCPSCREAFHRDTGWYLPYNELDERLHDKKSRLYRLWYVWRSLQFGNWLVEFRKEVKPKYPHFALSMYCTHWEQLISHLDHNLYFDIGDAARAVNLFGSEIMPRNAYCTARSLLPYRKLYNMYRIAFKSPPLWAWFYSSNWDVAYFSWAVSNMIGQCALIDNRMQRLPSVPDFLAFAGSPDNPPLDAMHSTAQVAVWLNTASRDFNRLIGLETELGGMAQCFEGAHIPYDILNDHAICNPEILRNYKVLFLCGVGCLSDDDVALVKDFARNGGTVFMTSNAGTCDSLGAMRSEWPFRDVFGFEPNPRDSHKLDSIYGKAGDVSIDDWKTIYRMAWALTAKPECDVVLHGKTEDGAEYPLLMEVPFGQGKMLYFATTVLSGCFSREENINAKWEFQQHEPFEELINKVLTQCIASAKPWEVNAPPLVFTNLLRSGDGTLYAHFVNGLGTKMKIGDVIGSGPLGTAWPQLEDDIVFTISGSTPKSVQAVSPDFAGRRALEFIQNDAGTVIRLPKELLRAYTLVEIRY